MNNAVLPLMLRQVDGGALRLQLSEPALSAFMTGVRCVVPPAALSVLHLG